MFIRPCLRARLLVYLQGGDDARSFRQGAALGFWGCQYYPADLRGRSGYGTGQAVPSYPARVLPTAALPPAPGAATGANDATGAAFAGASGTDPACPRADNTGAFVSADHRGR